MDILRRLGINIELFTNNAHGKIKQIDNAFGDLHKKVNGLAAAFTSVFALNRFKTVIAEGIKFGDQLDDLSFQLGISVEDFQKWSLVAEQVGVSSETIAKAFSFLNKAIGEAQLGTKSAIETLNLLKIDFKGPIDLNKALLQLADSLFKIDTNGKRAALSQRVLGRVGKDVALLLAQGPQQIQEIFNELDESGGVLSGKIAHDAGIMADKFLILDHVWKSTKTRFAQSFFPILQEIIKSLSKFANFLEKIETKTKLLSKVFVGLGTAIVIAGVASLAAWLPTIVMFGAIATVVTSLLIIFEDIYYFLTGKGTSAIELFLKDMLGLRNGQLVVEGIREAFNVVIEGIKIAIDYISIFINLLKQIPSFISNPFKFLSESGDIVRSRIPNLQNASVINFDRIKSFLSDGQVRFSDTPKNRKWHPEYFRELDARQISAHNKMQNNVTININGGDLVQVRETIRNELGSLFTFAREDFVQVSE